MAMSLRAMETGEEYGPWEKCPPEILWLIFEKLSGLQLVKCMFVNSKWRRLVMHIADYKNMWKEILESMVIHRGNYLQLRSKLPTNYRQLLYNSVLWTHVAKASFRMVETHNINNIKKMNVYRDNLIVVTSENVHYYGCEDFELRKTIDTKCREFIETPYMIAVAQDGNERNIKLFLYKKSSEDDINMSESNVVEVEQVMLYIVENRRCCVLDHRNVLIVFEINYPEWSQIFIARYYGNPFQSCFLHCYNEEVYLMLKCGVVLWADPEARAFVKVVTVPPPVVETFQTIYSQMFHKFGFIYGVERSEKLEFKSFVHGNQNVFVYRCPDISCVRQHGEMLIMGFLDGKVLFHMPRLLSTQATPFMHQLNIKDFGKEITDFEIVSLDIHESDGFQYMFIATNTQILHLKIMHEYNQEETLWKVYPKNWTEKLEKIEIETDQICGTAV